MSLDSLFFILDLMNSEKNKHSISLSFTKLHKNTQISLTTQQHTSVFIDIIYIRVRPMQYLSYSYIHQFLLAGHLLFFEIL